MVHPNILVVGFRKFPQSQKENRKLLYAYRKSINASILKNSNIFLTRDATVHLHSHVRLFYQGEAGPYFFHERSQLIRRAERQCPPTPMKLNDGAAVAQTS